MPRSVGQIPLYYNKKAPQSHDYVEMSASPLYPFGYGLSYTSYKYSNLKVSQSDFRHGDIIKVSVDVKNTGKVAGKESVLLFSSVSVALDEGLVDALDLAL